MLTQKYNFHLPTAKEREANKDLRGKMICPECGENSFVPYLDASGSIVDKDKFGRCERVNSCGFIRYPSGVEAHQKAKTTSIQPQPRPKFLDEKQRDEIFKPSLRGYDTNHLIIYLRSLFDEETVNKMITGYYLGTIDHFNGGATVFWQVDKYGNIHRGKIMQYDPTTGKRIKYKGNGLISSIHAIHDLGDLPSECLFGEHLLSKHRNMFVGLVESEKTAVIASGVVTDCLFLATGGCSKLSAAMCQVLKGRNVVLFPDNGKFDEWQEKGRKMRHLFNTISIVDIMERKETIDRYGLHDGDDIGDIIASPNFDIKDMKIELQQL
ncbi:MAG: hypothetical protein IKW83_07380 [Muribaculaceae bacterium]|nr:hypothetical protein [Muribaculaceae bacterium]